MVVKSKKRQNHFHDLRKVFERLRRYQLKMNPSKCAFGVTFGKFLRFIVRQRGRRLILYVAAQERSVGILLAQKNDEGKDNALYYLRLEIDVDSKELSLKVYGDSQLVNSPPILIYEPPEPLHPTVASWLFDAWGLGVVGPLTKSSGGHLYILAITDYFSIWVEAVPLKEVKKENVTDFIRTHIIYPYGVPRHIITDNGKPFYNSLIDKLCQKFGFKQRNSSMYYATANGLAEAFNKTLCNLLKKVVAKSKRDWYERIGEALWAYRTTVRTPTQATPYALIYGVEAILPLEQQIPSLRTAIREGLTEEENAQIRLEDLEALDEKRLEAQQRLECYQARLSRAFNKKVRLHSFQVAI
ncbi:UNVERIFIED_CONTAM: hypothetical protein Scaly_2841600 [Sesamum calycinum]|uniref:Integrase catalytic domain-containing protein n=1 Tax=Sesamum calycinum TaxID=2727403 RepID=A0AAW2IS89_9LAMI